jgi:hypothetical protein
MNRGEVHRHGHGEQEQVIVEHVRQTPGEWNEIRIHVCANVGTIGVTPITDLPGPVWLPIEVTMALQGLRESMVHPERGAWLMLDITVPRTGKATFAYDWMSKPDWPTTEGEFYQPLYLDDLQRFPSTPENIPEWYPVDPAGGVPRW